jgi:hypothetical protein
VVDLDSNNRHIIQGRTPARSPRTNTIMRPAQRQHSRRIEALKLGRSSQYLYWEAFITFIGKPHDGVLDLIFAPYRGG